MGNKEGKTLNSADLNNLENSTEFSRKDIQRWYKTFKKECTDNNMNLEDFQKIYSRIFPEGDATEYANHVFRVFDIDANGTIDFQEFVCNISMSTKGSIDEQLRWSFSIYDVDGNGTICRDEAIKILEAMYRARESKEEAAKKRPSRERAELVVDLIFERLDHDYDDLLTDQEFIDGVKLSPEVLSLMKE